MPFGPGGRPDWIDGVAIPTLPNFNREGSSNRHGDEWERTITPAATDYHVGREADPRHSLRPAAGLSLPAAQAGSGTFAGYPRVLGRAAAQSPTRKPLRSEILVRLRAGYLEVQPLTIGELRAVAITLRIVHVQISGGWRSGSSRVALHSRPIGSDGVTRGWSTIALHNSAGISIKARSVERMRHLLDQAANRIARKSRVGVERDDVANISRWLPGRRHESRVGRAAQEPVQLVQLPRLRSQPIHRPPGAS